MELITSKSKNKNAIIIKLLITVGIMSVIDGIISYIGLMNGVMEEGNPFMQSLWNISPILFLTFKLLISILLIAVGLLYKKTGQTIRKPIEWLAYLITALYTYVMILHILWISLT